MLLPIDFTTLIEGGTMMNSSHCLGMVLLLTTILSGCDDLVSKIAEHETSETRPTPPPKPKQPPLEEQAKAKLAMALDAWVFGDSIEEFGKANPDVVFLESDWGIHNYVLVDYEIGKIRVSSGTPEDPSKFQVVTTLTHATNGGREVISKKTYNVWPPVMSGGHWQILVERGK